MTLLVELSLEWEPLQDAIAEMSAALSALHERHGPQFRRLEARIRAIETEPGDPVVFPLGDALIVTPPAEWTEILREARRLKVI